MAPRRWLARAVGALALVFAISVSAAPAAQSASPPDPPTTPDLVHVFRVRPVGYASNSALIHICTVPLKASPGFESQRLTECTGIRDSMNTLPSGSVAFLLGDFNFYTG